MVLNRDTFFTYVRRAPFGGRLTQSQVDGMNAKLDYWEANGDGDLRKVAYVFATDFHETAAAMQPVTEKGKRSYFDQYETGTAKGKVLGNTQPGDGYRFRGRGDVQLTGRKNYALFSRMLGIDLLAKPELALRLDVSTKVLFEGMKNGSFTGRRLEQYFNASVDDSVGARKIVNGTDKASLIASYYGQFLGAFQAASQAAAPADVTPEAAAADKPNFAKDATTIGAGIAALGTGAGFFGDIIAKIDNPYALGALSLAVIGIVIVFIGRSSLARKKGV